MERWRWWRSSIQEANFFQSSVTEEGLRGRVSRQEIPGGNGIEIPPASTAGSNVPTVGPAVESTLEVGGSVLVALQPVHYCVQNMVVWTATAGVPVQTVMFIMTILMCS
ncbi:hypothetical protein NDU88_001829 [Pleurodeles waltl]|uniref:Uncharacterized protein n=1 Tax=Pleurodeles waltl TaxID=8319 RepID=A0AAV7T0L4_PLEWA|nr:hypothetical protein NDU88_001829 [Pleurodeles waltl]